MPTTNSFDANIMAVKVDRVPGTMDVSIDVLYYHMESLGVDSLKMKVKYATCFQIIKNTSNQYIEKS